MASGGSPALGPCSYSTCPKVEEGMKIATSASQMNPALQCMACCTPHPIPTPNSGGLIGDLSHRQYQCVHSQLPMTYQWRIQYQGSLFEFCTWNVVLVYILVTGHNSEAEWPDT